MTSLIFTIALFISIFAFCAFCALSRRAHQRQRERQQWLDAQHLSGIDQQ